MRVVQLNTDCSDFQLAVQNQNKPFGGLTKYQLYNVYDKVKGWDKLLSGDKDISFYIFRYRYTKQLYADGYDVPTIAAMLGYTNTLTVQSYLLARVSEVFSKPPIGFVDIGGVWWSQDNFAISDDGPGIYDFRGGTNLWMGRHYTVDAIVRVLDGLGVYRLPSEAEWYVLRDYCLNEHGAQTACLANDMTKWYTINSHMINAFGLQISGSGYVYKNQLWSFKSQGRYIVAPALFRPYYNVIFNPVSLTFSSVSMRPTDAASVRVVIA